MKNRAFTLIELLVVVLIIGILSAIALPQYQKAVWKSKNTQLKELVRAVWQAEHVYYLANGEYTKNFADLGIELPLSDYTGGSANVCSLAGTNSTSVSKQGKDFAITTTSSDLSSYINVWGLWTEGPYQCKGFAAGSSKNGAIYCVGAGSGSAQTGDFCEKLEAGTWAEDGTGTKYYSLP